MTTSGGGQLTKIGPAVPSPVEGFRKWERTAKKEAPAGGEAFKNAGGVGSAPRMGHPPSWGTRPTSGAPAELGHPPHEWGTRPTGGGPAAAVGCLLPRWDASCASEGPAAAVGCLLRG
ncbi:hypothetical protein Aca07nite_82630 [Actinoplanes capillaceus]|uniref:Uncharacterized protein n=1 Tax=Actinoplanes campanulatus TaxID=113559 RepID=A0ABQ3WXW7_9ACTN|nr:hypothetical protein Aca07nite_82630 [Actinoplanes capillaceus]